MSSAEPGKREDKDVLMVYGAIDMHTGEVIPQLSGVCLNETMQSTDCELCDNLMCIWENDRTKICPVAFYYEIGAPLPEWLKDKLARIVAKYKTLPLTVDSYGSPRITKEYTDTLARHVFVHSYWASPIGNFIKFGNPEFPPQHPLVAKAIETVNCTDEKKGMCAWGESDMETQVAYAILLANFDRSPSTDITNINDTRQTLHPTWEHHLAYD